MLAIALWQPCLENDNYRFSSCIGGVQRRWLIAIGPLPPSSSIGGCGNGDRRLFTTLANLQSGSREVKRWWVAGGKARERSEREREIAHMPPLSLGFCARPPN
nr:hypothetical protein Iba_chr01aCG6350 [Ipomoea batatas]GME10053.1 hypothetical protein Iba_scaffold9406CG0010 [Ipomoea batatas]